MRLLRAILAGAGLCLAPPAAADPPPPAEGAFRVATFNVSLSRRGAGMLLRELQKGGAGQPSAVAEILQRVRPDIVLLNEFDHDREQRALSAFVELLREGRGGAAPIDYPYVFAAPVNTGVRSGLDLDGDGVAGGPGDAHGWGLYPGHYGMAILSRFPLDFRKAREFRKFAWTALPGALLPRGFYGSAAKALRLSSKSHWDVPATLPDGRVLHILAAHPTPPVFDGPEDRNGRRNHDETRFWVDYLEDAGHIVDDAGRRGGLPADAAFVVLGDLNADPADGDARREALAALLSHPRLQDPAPRSAGAVEAAASQRGRNARHEGDPALDTADWNDRKGPGNLRVDYVLPSAAFEVTGAGVFWPPPDDPLSRLVEGGRRPASSDHRLVWVDLR